MKRPLLCFIFALLFLSPGFATPDSVMYKMLIRGYVLDSTTGLPVANHQVHFFCNTPNTYPPLDTTRTGLNGYFAFDTLITATNGNMNIDVYTYDCSGNKISQFLTQYQSTVDLVFQICSPDSCSLLASFGWDVHPVNTLQVQFYDLSLGNYTNRLWNFGDGSFSALPSPVHTYANPGTYLVSLQVSDTSLSVPCFSIDTQYVEVELCQYHNLAGQVFSGSFPHQHAKVFLYMKTPSDYFLLDSCFLNSNGVYFFYHIPEGDYLLKAIPLNAGAPNNFLWPTYYGNVLNWSDAYHVHLDSDLFNVNIQLSSVFSFNVGPGQLSGTLSRLHNGNFSPLPQGQVILTAANNANIGYAFSGQQGSFLFDDLPLGTYNLMVEVPGMMPNALTFSLTAALPQISNIQLTASTSAIGIEDCTARMHVSRVFPNPASHALNLEVTTILARQVQFSLADLTGRALFAETRTLSPGQHLITLPLSNIQAGTYILGIISGNDQREFFKVQIIR